MDTFLTSTLIILLVLSILRDIVNAKLDKEKDKEIQLLKEKVSLLENKLKA